MSMTFDAPEFTPLDLATLQHLTPEQWAQRVFTPNPSLQLLQTSYPVNRYLQAVYDDQAPTLPAPVTSQAAIFRKDYKVWRHDLPPAMFAILTALTEGQPLGEALAAGGDHQEDFRYWFGEWSSDGLFV